LPKCKKKKQKKLGCNPYKGFFKENFEKNCQKNWGFTLSSLDLEDLFLHIAKQHQACKINKLSNLYYFHFMLNLSLDATQ
jgi:hypothetical protein